MKRTNLVQGAATVAVLLLPILAISKDQVGINDYAKAQWSTTKSCVPFVRKYESVCGATFATDLATKGTPLAGKYDIRADVNACTSLPPEDRPAVQKGQVFSINLQQAFISSFHEWTSPFSQKGKGEIAVVARVAEMDEASDFDFSQGGRDRARLVYYSEGVSPGQFLNFSQLPVYGPIEYGGKPLLLELYILELDIKANTEISGLLTAAAGLGAVAYPPASPILQVLDTIGGGLLKAKKSDTEFKYHASLVSSQKIIPSLKTGVLEFGNYAFVRMPEPDVQAGTLHQWSSWAYNQKNGRIYTDDDCSKPLNERTYLTFQINRANEEASLDRSNTFLKFQAKLQSEARANTQAQVNLISGLGNIVIMDKAYQDAKQLIAYASSVRYAKGILAEKSSISVATKIALDTVISDVKASLNPATGTTPVYQKTNAESLVGHLGRLAGYTTALSPLAFEPAAIKLELATPTPAP